MRSKSGVPWFSRNGTRQLRGQACLRSISFGFILTVGAWFAPTAAAQTIIVDNTDAAFHVLSGNWTTSSMAAGYYGPDYVYRSTTAGGAAPSEVEWRPVLPVAGLYEVAVRYTDGTNRADNAPYTIEYQGGAVTHVVNQQVGGGQWRILGTYPFAAGEAGCVRLSNDAHANVVIADAVRIRVRLATVPGCASDEYDSFATDARAAYAEIDDRFNFDSYASSTDGGVLAWSESYILEAFLAMYEATHEMQYLDRVMDHADLIFAHRGDRIGMVDEIRGRMIPAWIATPRHGRGYGAWLVHQGLITSHIARWIYLVNRDPGLRVQYGQKADQYLADIIETMDAFEPEVHDGPGAGEQYYTFPDYYQDPEIGQPDDPLPFNQQNAVGRTYQALWLITGQTRFRDRAEGLARFFRNRLVPVDDRWYWEYSSISTWGEDLGHAEINVDFAFQCYRAGLIFTEPDMQRFARTLWFLSLGPEQGFRDNVNGHESPTEDKSSYTGHWMRLGFVDPSLRQLYHDYFMLHYAAGGPIAFLLGSAILTETSHPFRPDAPLPGPAGSVVWTDRETVEASGTHFTRPEDALMVIRNAGLGTLEYTISSDADWLTATPAGGSVTCGQDAVSIRFGADAWLPEDVGQHVAHLTVSAAEPSVAPRVITVQLDTVPFTGDFDADGGIDPADVGSLLDCLGGPGVAYASGGLPPACACRPDTHGHIAADLDLDGDVDQEDFGLLQRGLGP
jgi:hypothetical protein